LATADLAEGFARSPARPPARNRFITPWTVRIASLLVVGVAWELAGRIWGGILFPPLTDVLAALGRLIVDPEVHAALLDSFSAFALGLVAASIVGLVIGAVMGRVDLVGRFGVHYTAFFLAVPMSTLIPVVVVAAGVGLLARATVVFLFAVFEIIWNTYLGVHNVDRAKIEMATSYGARGLRLYGRVLIPAALPAILAGLRLGTGRAFIGMISAELLLASVGLGLLMKRFQSRFQSEELFAVVLLMLLIAAVVIGVMQFIERRLLRRFAPS
jgi:ABC-type nitrate/sulfonate/bicarbonate transport system permease component